MADNQKLGWKHILSNNKMSWRQNLLFPWNAFFRCERGWSWCRGKISLLQPRVMSLNCGNNISICVGKLRTSNPLLPKRRDPHAPGCPCLSSFFFFVFCFLVFWFSPLWEKCCKKLVLILDCWKDTSWERTNKCHFKEHIIVFWECNALSPSSSDTPYFKLTKVLSFKLTTGSF